MIVPDEVILAKARELGLDPCPVEWVVAPAHVVYDVASRGVPGRFAHWTHGKGFWRMKAGYDVGASRIYELVLPTNPSIAFLLEGNTEVEHLLVKAHVYGHADFSNHNRYFKTLPPNSHELASVRAERIRGYEHRYGRDRVEALLTAALTVAEFVDPEPYVGWREETDETPPNMSEWAGLEQLGKPTEAIAPIETTRRWHPTSDILNVLVHEADALADWERDLISIVREESLYFWPIRKTKIINEGWASYWHQQILRGLDLSDGHEVEFARLHAGVTGSHGMHLNPYHLGLVIWRSIEKHHGREAMFQIRAEESDISFVRNWLTEEIVREEGLYTWRVSGDRVLAASGQDKWELVRDAICNELAETIPQIEVASVASGGGHSMALVNRSERKLDTAEAENVMDAIESLWRHSVTMYHGEY